MHSFDDDKELDQLTKTAAEAIEAPNAANWEKMQRALDRELPQQKKRRGGIIWWLLPILLVAGLGYFGLPNSSKQIAPNQNETGIRYNNQQATKVLTPEADKKSSIITGKISEQNNSSSLKQTVDKSLTRITTKKASSSTEPNSTKEILASPSLPEELKPSGSGNTCCIVSTETATNKQPIPLDTMSRLSEIKVEEQPLATQIKNSESKSIPKKQQNTNKGFFIGLIGGFDASTVKYNYVSNVGYNIGGTLGYRFNKHWSLQSGAIYTQKNYKLKGQDFHPPKGSWISYYEIEMVDGYCKMWDVPIIATYHFSGNNNGNTFLSLGTSSYFMKRENYNYLYYYNNQYYNRTNNYNSSDQHLFALLHISAGIERPIGKSITSIIEPYAKIPLTGVGFGSIQLSSFGLNFSVQYRQPKK